MINFLLSILFLTQGQVTATITLECPKVECPPVEECPECPTCPPEVECDSCCPECPPPPECPACDSCCDECPECPPWECPEGWECTPPASPVNLIIDPSFEIPMQKNRWGHVFQEWAGWIWEGDSEFRVSNLARSGDYSLVIIGGHKPKLRAAPRTALALEPGRYKMTAFIRAMDITPGLWNGTTELMMNGKYMGLGEKGTFNWRPLEYVFDVPSTSTSKYPSFGLMGQGYLFVDDVTVEEVTDDTPLTDAPVVGSEEPSDPIGEITNPIRCPECARLNDTSWEYCVYDGTPLAAQYTIPEEPVKLITSFEGDDKPFSPGVVVQEHATDGLNALRLDSGYTLDATARDWSGYTFLKADIYTDAPEYVGLRVEFHDELTQDYWTRVNYYTLTPSGQRTLIVPLDIYVGEKSRPGRPLLVDRITKVAFAIEGGDIGYPIYIDNVRVEYAPGPQVPDNTLAFDVTRRTAQVLPGFQRLDINKLYDPARGWGWNDELQVWRTYDVLQPEPLYQDFICIEKGGLIVDVPNGSYKVFVNMDTPSGYWGEYQKYHERSLTVEGVSYTDTMDINSFKAKYYKNWLTEDLPSDNTFDKYQEPYYDEKLVTAEVTDGQLNIDFSASDWGACVSAIVIYPEAQEVEGEAFLTEVREERRFWFDNFFKRTLSTNPPDEPGVVIYSKDYMEDILPTDPAGEPVAALELSAFQGEFEPVALTIKSTGQSYDTATITSTGIGDIPAPEISSVLYRIKRINSDGSAYTIKPRNLIPTNSASLPDGINRTFILDVEVPADATPGVHTGNVLVDIPGFGAEVIPIQVTVLPGTLDEVDIPAGPFGYTINLPWYSSPEVDAWNDSMAVKSLELIKKYGFNTVSFGPGLSFSEASGEITNYEQLDSKISTIRSVLDDPIFSYGTFYGVDIYYQDLARAERMGFTEYEDFVKALWDPIQTHGEENGWGEILWAIGDEPVGSALDRAILNVTSYREAYPEAPPLFTFFTSFTGDDPLDKHFLLSKELHTVSLGNYDAASVSLLQSEGGEWGSYNNGNRWTFGIHMFKAVKEHGMKHRIAWFWNIVAGDPYYALDAREDDYAWCNSGPNGEMVQSLKLKRLREGIDDYRRLLTLSRLNPNNQTLVDIMSSFTLDDRAEPGDYTSFREALDSAIEEER